MEGADSAELLARLMRPAKAVLVGEIHGTNEFPQLVTRAVTLATRRVRVLAGIELTATALSDRGCSPWTGPPDHHDGRASAAMAGLLDTLDPLSDVTVFSASPAAFCDEPPDAAMASAIAAEMARAPDAAVLVLLGNAHAATSPADGRADASPTGFRLRAAGVDVLSVLGIPSDGTFWGITEAHGSARVHRLIETPGRELADRYDRTMEIGQITASLPPSPWQHPPPRTA